MCRFAKSYWFFETYRNYGSGRPYVQKASGKDKKSTMITICWKPSRSLILWHENLNIFSEFSFGLVSKSKSYWWKLQISVYSFIAAFITGATLRNSHIQAMLISELCCIFDLWFTRSLVMITQRRLKRQP